MPIHRAAQAGQGGMKPVPVACLNLATVPLGIDFDKLVASTQMFLDQHFTPVWGYPVHLFKVFKEKDLPAEAWRMICFDSSDDAGALGYHDVAKDGQPVSKIFVKDTLADHELVSVTFCHEACEMIVDPTTDLWSQDAKTGLVHAYEMCDAVEEDTFLVNGVPMSNFLHPAYFENRFVHPKGTKFDHLGKLTAPYTMTKGGYQIHMKGGRVTEVYGSKAKEARFKKSHRRGHRSELRKHTNGHDDALIIRA